MRKFRLFLDIQKEEDWLNGMVQKGWLCRHVSSLGIYHFEKTDATDQVIRIDYQTFKSKEEKERYIDLYEEYGWQHLGSTWLHYWLKPADGMDELFSDDASQKAHLRRLLTYYGTFGMFLVIITFSIFNNNAPFTNLKDAYYTPGLWEKEGGEFLFSFLFETPFALMRFGAPWLLAIWAIMFAAMCLKYSMRIKK